MRALKIILLIVLIPLLLVAGALTFAWFQRTGFAEDILRERLAEQNIAVESLTVSSVSARQITLSDVALGEGGALRAKSAQLNFKVDWTKRDWGNFYAVLKGVEARALLSEGQLLLGGVERAWGTALITPTADATAIRLTGDLEISGTKGGQFAGRLEKGQLTLSQQQKDLLLPLKLVAQGNGDAQRIIVQGMFYNDARQIDGDFNGSYALAEKRGQLKWNTKPIAFAPDGFTFAQLSPAYAEDFATFATRLSVAGTLDMRPGSWTVTPRLTIYEIPIEALLKDVLGEGTRITGMVKGEVPVRVSKGGNWRIEPADLKNIGNMHIALAPGTAGDKAFSAHPQAEVIKGALGNLQVEEMSLHIVSLDDKGGVKMQWHFKGRNPDYLNGKPVDLNLAVTANLRDMWRSATEVKKLQREAEQELLKSK